MKLIDSETTWFFVSGSDEERFLDDIAFGIQCLLYRGVSLENIFLFVDNPGNINLSDFYPFPEEVTVETTDKIRSRITAIDCSNLAIVVTGHGCEYGIAASSNISPYKLLEIIKSNTNLKYALVVLGQCFAGTFNFLEARSKDRATGEVISPEICIVGATDLTFSISVTVSIADQEIVKEFDCPKEWLANLFLFFFMYHIALPIDIDGDDKLTVIDTYKIAGILTNSRLRDMKQKAFISLQETLLTSTLSQLTEGEIAKRLAEKAKQDLANTLNIILTNQNFWILNANLSRKLEL